MIMTQKRSPDERMTQKKNPDERMTQKKNPDVRMTQKKNPDERMTQKKSPNERITQKKNQDVRMIQKKSPNERMTQKKSPNERMTQEKNPDVRMTQKKSPNERMTQKTNPVVRMTQKKSQDVRMMQKKNRDVSSVAGEPKQLLILAYQRTGSSFFGQIFDNDPDAFYVFEPLDGLYNSLYGTRHGWAVPTDIYHFPDGSLRLVAGRGIVHSPPQSYHSYIRKSRHSVQRSHHVQN